MSRPLRKGWCPSVLRPMPTGDGLLVRLRPLGGVMSLAQAAAIAECAAACGNGHLDLTSRANLQIRGVREATLAELVERLRQVGLLGEESGAGLDVVSSPLAGVDPSALIDVRPVVAALMGRAAADAALRALPAKFGFVVDGGGQVGLAGVAADVRFTAVRSDVFEVQLAHMQVGLCAPDAVPDVAAAIAARFQELCGTDHRIRPVIERIGLRVFMERGPLLPPAGEGGTRSVTDEGGSTASIPPPPAGDRGCEDRPHPTLADARATFSRSAGEGARVLGVGSHHLGVAFPFGRLEASDLTILAALPCARDIRLTPWRALLITGASQAAATLNPTRFILDPTDPRLAVAACPGAPACASATTATRADAAALAALLPHGVPKEIALHISGCAKGCAHARPARITLVGNAGRYDLVRDGTAQSAPVATGLTPRAAAAMLSRATGEAA